MIFFPFSAIVGQDKAKLALICNAIDPTIGGVLLSGDKGTGTSTMVRAFSQVLPEIEVVEGCAFNCNPYNIAEMCDACRERAERGELSVARRKMRVIDLPLSVTLDRLVGTIEISKALKEGIRALQPGILAEANRNILYIDEVNLLEDYIADVLLDSAAMGWNFVEREGISLKHPSKFILVGSMNPEEGELRPQLLDRFGMFVAIEASQNAEERIEIVKRVTEFQKDPQGFYEKYRKQDEKLRASIVKAKEILGEVEIEEELLKLLVETIIQLGIKTHRAEITTAKTAKAIAALAGRKKVSIEDLNKAMELTLPHRLKSRPFQKPQMPQIPQRQEKLTSEQ
ncbi:MAG: ATP-binding protein, partial [Archaeoglobaceae archaeon]